MPKKSTSNLFQEEEKDVIKEETIKKTTKVSNDVKSEQEQIENDIVDIDLSAIKKKRFRINGDNSKILELNTSDMGIVTRLKEAYPRLNDLMDSVTDKFSNLPDDDEDDEVQLTALSDAVNEIDKQMRAEIDFIFNSNVSEICGSEGSMWDPIDGSFRYEHIIDKLTKLYENNLDKEYASMKRRVENKAGKYVKLQDHKQKVKR